MAWLLFYLISIVVADPLMDSSHILCDEFTGQFESASGHEAAEQALYRLTHPSIEGVFFEPSNELDFGEKELFL
jgi:hypothetical protein